MSMNRIPRKLLTGWVRHPRPIGAPQMTIGRTINKALSKFNISTDFKQWRSTATKKAEWRHRTHPDPGVRAKKVPSAERIHRTKYRSNQAPPRPGVGYLRNPYRDLPRNPHLPRLRKDCYCGAWNRPSGICYCGPVSRLLCKQLEEVIPVGFAGRPGAASFTNSVNFN